MSDKNIDKEKELLEQLEEFKKEILLNREASMGVSNYIFMDDEEVFYLIDIIEKQHKELETYKKLINTAINYILNNTHIEHDGDDYGYTEWIEIDTDTTTFITTLKNILENEVLKDE